MVLVDRKGFRFPNLMFASNSTQDLAATDLATATLPLSASPLTAPPLSNRTTLSTEGFTTYLPLATPTEFAETASAPSASTTSSMTRPSAMPSRAMIYPTPSPTAAPVLPTGMVSRPQSATAQSGSACCKTVFTASKAYDFAPLCLINALRLVLTALLCLYGFAYPKIVFTTSKAYDLAVLSMVHALRLVLTLFLCLYGLAVYSPILTFASMCFKFLVHLSMECCGANPNALLTYFGDSKIPIWVYQVGLEGFPTDAAAKLQTNSCLIHDEGVLAGDAGTCVLRASRAGDIDVSSKEKAGEVRIPGSQDKVDGSHDEDFGSQTMIRGYGGTSPQSRDTSRRCEREQPGDPEIAHRSQQSALGLDNIVHSSQGTTSNTRLSCDRTLILPVSGRGAVTLPSPPVDHWNMSPVSSPSSILSSGSSSRTSIDSKPSLGGSQTDETLPNNLKGADRTLSDQLFFLDPKCWRAKKAAHIVNSVLPSNSSLWRSYACGKKAGKGGTAKVRVCSVDEEKMVIKRCSRILSDSFFLACEAAVMKALDHPNIVRFHSASRWMTDVYIAMEYMNAGDVSQLRMRCSESLIATVMREALKGLAHMHEHNYAHRDIKPWNLFLSKNGEVKIGDFGAAKDVRVGKGASPRGTEEFLPPESYDRIYTPAGDIWSLALTALDLFFGEVPKSWSRYICRIIKTPPPIHLGVSRDFQRFLQLVGNLDWKKRATAQELLDLPFIKNAPPTSALIPLIQAERP